MTPPPSTGKIFPYPSRIGRVWPGYFAGEMAHRTPKATDFGIARWAILFRRKRTLDDVVVRAVETTNNGGGKLRRELKGLSSFMARYF